VGGSEKSLFLRSGAFLKNRLFTADFQNDAHSPSRMHTVTLVINGLDDDALQNVSPRIDVMLPLIWRIKIYNDSLSR